MPQSSSQVQRSRPKQQLFRFHLERNIENQQNESLYFRRLNRFRYNSYNQNSFLKWGRFKYPIMFALGVSILFDFTFRKYQPITPGH